MRLNQLDPNQFRTLATSPDVTDQLPTTKPQQNDDELQMAAKLLALQNAAPYGTAATTVMSTALEASRVLKASAGKLHELSVTNTKASAQWVLIMNAATLPGDGAVTLLYPPIPVAAGALVRVVFERPLIASTGLVVSNSSTGTFNKTIGAADCVFHARVTD